MSVRKQHLVLVPLMAQGHMIPMMDVARLLAERGVLVSVITTPVNASRIRAATDHLTTASSLPIRLVELRFPCAEAGLPDGCENLHLVPSVDLFANFFLATRLLRHPLELFLQEEQPRPTCIISDLCLPWTREVASKLQIPRLVFNVGCCFFLLCSHIIHRNKLDESITDDMEPFLVPNLPVPIQVTRAQAPGFGGPGSDRDGILEAVSTAEGVLMNSFNDLEPWIIERYQEAIGKKAWAIGPLSLCNKDAATMAARGSKPSIDANECLSWLESMRERSVIFVCFGSTVNTPPSQLIEIGSGLEASGRPFIWVMKEEDNSPEMEKWMSDGFEERTSSRSLIIRGWAPQAAILSHPAIGGFMTHCGWNSAVEAISAGLPMITWPHFADQFLNERLIVEILKIGLAIGVKTPITHVDEKSEALVKRDEVEKAVRSLMDEGEEGEERRERAREYGDKARKAMEEGGSSYTNVTLLIEFIISQQFSDKVAEGNEV